jgi:hypothetical protein
MQTLPSGERESRFLSTRASFLSRISRFLCLAVCVAALTLGARTARAGLDVIIVYSATDSGPGSLRAAIEEANISPFVTTIAFDLLEFGGSRKTIPLTSPLPALTTNRRITMAAPAVGVEISGENVTRVLEVGPAARLAISGVTFRNGNAGLGDGGGILNAGLLTLTGCTFVDNSAARGAALCNASNLTGATLTLVNCTFTGNSASVWGGAIFNASGLVKVVCCTISSNTASVSGGSGIASTGDAATRTEVSNSIVSGNGSPGATDVDLVGGATPSFVSRDFNLVGDGNATGAFALFGDVTGNVSPGLGPLAENGGPTQTRLPLAGSPAINTGGQFELDTDQRGVARQPYAPFDRGAVEVATAIPLFETLTVNTTGDEDNRTSDPRFGRGTSLREAMNYANRDGVDSVITFDPVVFAAPRKTITLGGVQLPVIIWDGKFAIPAPPAGLELSGNNLSRVLHFADSVPGAPEADVTLTGLTIRDGRSDKGGGIANAGNLVMESCTVRDNFAQEGGGLYAQTYSFPVFIRNCTFSGNTAADSGAAIYNQGPMLLESSTITGNASANRGAVWADNNNPAWDMTVRNSIIAGNAGGDVAIGYPSSEATLFSQGYNLIGTHEAGVEAFVQPGDVTDVLDPDLAPLAENGGQTATHLPLPTSLAINTGQTALTVDQRGITRPQPAGGSADKGAVEYNIPIDPALIVTTTSDVVNPADGVVSLREAVARANSDGVASPITFSEAVFAAPRKTITLTGGALVLGGNSRLTIRAPAAGVRISGGGTSRVFETASDADVTLEGLTIASGNATGQSGGGILNSGDLEVDRCTLTGNSATNGGAILSDTAASGRTLKLRNTTVSGNGAVTLCGGIYNRGGRTEIESCTITGNSSFTAGPNGIAALVGANVETYVRNSIVSVNGSGASTDVGLINGSTNSFVSGGYNLIGDGNATAAFNESTDVTGNTDPGLSALAENGGPTPTRLPIVTSPAVQTGDTALRLDQRGVRRPQRARFDRGACELDASAFIDSLIVTTVVDEDDQLTDPRFGTGTSLREAIDLANADGGDSTITFDPAVFNSPRKRITLDGSQLPRIMANGTLTITAPPAGVEVSANRLSGVFQIDFGGNATFQGLTIRDGLRGRDGNFENRGGGISALGRAVVEGCTFINNFSENGGAIYNLFGPLTVRNSTFNGNEAVLAGGAITASQTLILDSCTIAGNRCAGSGGVWASSVAQVRNTIIAENLFTASDHDFRGPNATATQSGGYNLIGRVQLGDGSPASGVFTAAGDQMIGTASPGLGPLQSNGGPTPTMGVLLTSPALNAGNTTLTLDQRGISRPRGSAAEIGAFELIPLTIGPGVAPGAIGQAYAKKVAVTGGLAPYSVSLVSESLPPGLSMDGSGLVSGTPLAGGSYSFTVQATDPLASLGQGSVSLQVGRISAPFAGEAVAWYRAEGNAQSFTGPAGTIGGTVGYAPGVVGQAFSFSGGAGYVALSPGLFPVPTTGNTSTAPFSFETWFATTGSGIILGQQGSNVAPYGAALGTIPAIYVGADGRLRVEMFWTGAINQVTSPAAVNDGQFHHLAAIFNGTHLIAYLDGVSIGTVPITQVGYSTSYFYQLGTGYSPGNRPSLSTGWINFTGLLDETAIYHRALTAAEVQALWGAGSKGKSTRPYFTVLSRTGSNFTFTLTHWPSLRFQVEHSPALLPSGYLDVGSSFTGEPDGATDLSITLPSVGPTGFLRAYEVP